MVADTIVSFSASEGMFNNAFGTGAVDIADFNLGSILITVMHLVLR
ncbi:MAG: hypothetical protein CM1200mP10_26890 [Candidatus Neomarinimicrobiota bacterium]|nr:MAG: hypothetical protein CM1200mP10_26890 [Candidatus Neomarinimicrobiota bacterium]